MRRFFPPVATVLARAIFSEGCRMVAAGHDPTTLKRGIEKAVAPIVEELKHLSKPMKDPKEIARVGTISANKRLDHRFDRVSRIDFGSTEGRPR